MCNAFRIKIEARHSQLRAIMVAISSTGRLAGACKPKDVSGISTMPQHIAINELAIHRLNCISFNVCVRRNLIRRPGFPLLPDISNSINIYSVVVNGGVLDRARLDQLLDDAKVPVNKGTSKVIDLVE